MSDVAISAGQLRHKLGIYNQASVVGDRGQNVGDWELAATVFGSVRTLSGREAEIARSVHPEAMVEIVLRFTPDLYETSKLTHGDSTYFVLSINNVDQRNRKLIVTCGIDKTFVNPGNAFTSGFGSGY